MKSETIKIISTFPPTYTINGNVYLQLSLCVTMARRGRIPPGGTEINTFSSHYKDKVTWPNNLHFTKQHAAFGKRMIASE